MYRKEGKKMIVFYLKETGECMLSIDCDPTEITVEGNKAYWNGKVVNNDMTRSAMAEVPKQPIRDANDVPRKFPELKAGTATVSLETRVAAIEAKQASMNTNVQSIASKVGVTLLKEA